MNQLAIKDTIKNFKYAFCAQIIILGLGVLKSLVLPGYYNIEAFGYWQVYLFYSSYVGLFALGFNDGIYLRYGKSQYSELPFIRMRGAIWIYILMLLLFTFTFCTLSLLVNNRLRAFSLFCSSLNILIMGFYGVLVYVFQITNQIKLYSFFSMVDKLIVTMSILIVIFINNRNFQVIIIADLISKLIVVLIMIYYTSELWLGISCSFHYALEEFKKNISIGINLMIANLMGMFVLGLGRLSVDIYGDIQNFSHYSFGISLTNLVLMMTTSISMVLYPTFKRINKEKYLVYFININTLITFFNYFSLIIYFVAWLFIFNFLPNYTPMLKYLNLLFCIIILQNKMQLVNNTFYKVLREEKAMLKANFFSVLMFILLIILFFQFTKSCWAIAFCTFLTMFFRCYSSEFYLNKKIGIKTNLKKFLYEICFLIFFIFDTLILDIYNGLLIYIISLTCFTFVNRSDLLKLFNRATFTST